jgi:hypothetical protein
MESWLDKFGFIMIITLVALLITSISMTGKKEESITFNVVGITNNSNSSLVQLHFECIKYCVYHLTSGTNAQYRCYDECAKLGTIQCGE